jgi:hypothetical protein
MTGVSLYVLTFVYSRTFECMQTFEVKEGGLLSFTTAALYGQIIAGGKALYPFQ